MGTRGNSRGTIGLLKRLCSKNVPPSTITSTDTMMADFRRLAMLSRRAEQRHHAVAGEVLDRPFVAVHGLADPPNQAVH